MVKYTCEYPKLRFGGHDNEKKSVASGSAGCHTVRLCFDAYGGVRGRGYLPPPTRLRKLYSSMKHNLTSEEGKSTMDGRILQ